MATKLKDARIVVKLDTKAATAKAKKLRGEEGRQEERKGERTDKRREERREERQKRKEKTRLAVIPGVGRGVSRLFKLVKGLVAIRVFEEAAGLAGGFFAEAGKGKVVEPVTDVVGELLVEAAAAITKLRTLIAAYLTVTGQVTDVARAQKIVAGEVDFADLGKFAATSINVNAMLAAVEARKQVIGREALGRVLAEGAEKLKTAITSLAPGGHN